MSVVMACKNSNLDLLTASINAVLRQSYNNFEFIIVDDGSEMPMEPAIRKISNDERIVLYRIEPSGLGAALNYGIDKSNGVYLARIDDDDLMAHDRLEKQVKYLDCHFDVSCVGSQRYSFCNGRYMKHRRFPTEHEEIIRCILSQRWAMSHSALMFRRNCFDKIGGYRIKGVGQDVDLMIQMGTVGYLANVDDYLIYYNLGMASLSLMNPTNRLKAYLFAFEDIKRQNQFPAYTKEIEESISRIKYCLESNQSKTSWKKWLLYHFISNFGRKLDLKVL